MENIFIGFDLMLGAAFAQLIVMIVILLITAVSIALFGGDK